MIVSIFLLIIGFVTLVAGAEALVRGASSLSRKAGISALVIGLTVVAVGTSAPELAVNIIASVNNNGDVAIGNVVGSNIANLLLILGIGATIAPLQVKFSTTWREIPFALLAATVLLIFSSDIFLDGAFSNVLSRADGLVMLVFFLIFAFYTYTLAHSSRNTAYDDDKSIKQYSFFTSIILIIAGLSGLVLGGQLIVDNAVEIARALGMSEMFIGVTVVAVGTSLPELATTIIAIRKGQADMAIGNIIGSNIFNILWVLGVSSVIMPITMSAAAQFDTFITVLATLGLFALLFVGQRHMVQRWQGMVLLACYVGYIIFSTIRG